MKWRDQTIACRGLGWDAFAVRLATVLRARARGDDRFVIVSATRRHRFVQFASNTVAKGLRGEAVSNRFLEKEERLSRPELAALKRLEWNAPNRAYPNFWRMWRTETDLATPAAVAVRTLRDAFGIASPAALSISCGSFASDLITSTYREAESDVPRLSVGDRVANRSGHRVYRVGRRLGEGGFGAAYRVTQVSGQPKYQPSLCLKIAIVPDAWHREAYFGQLLQGVARAVAVHDSFAAFVPSPASTLSPLYCLVTEYAAHGDLGQYFAQRRRPWSETRACREVAELVRVLVRLHEAGAVHRDLTPQNVLVTAGERLKLGDFGIARHRIGRQAVRANVFNEGGAPTAIVEGHLQRWHPADDVYQMGLILAILVSGTVEFKLNRSDVKALRCSPRVKGIIQRAIGERRKRYADATAMLEALVTPVGHTRSVPLPSSLAGKVVVFTGALSITRRHASMLAEQAGAIVRPKVASTTDILVKGIEPRGGWKASDRGQKGLDREHERDRGHDICEIDERAFLTLVGQ